LPQSHCGGGKPANCVVRKCEPRGTPKMCNGLCHVYEECVAYSRRERDNHDEATPNFDPSKSKDVSGSSQICPYCGKPIARSTTPRHAYRGMLVNHVKANHPDKLEELRVSFINETE